MNRRKQEGAVFADVHHPRALMRLERAPQGPYDLEAHLRPSVSVPAHSREPRAITTNRGRSAPAPRA